MRTHDVSSLNAFGCLTQKQRDVLDLVIEHKSSKEIARALQISPYTVDQRVAAVRQKLKLSSRAELARFYSHYKAICGETAYEIPHVDSAFMFGNDGEQEGASESVYTLSDVHVIKAHAPWQVEDSDSFTLEAFDSRFGIWGRVFAVLVFAGLLAITFLAVASIAQTLNNLT